MKISRQVLFLAVLLVFFFGCKGLPKEFVNDNVPRMTPEELKTHLGDPEFIILDNRTAYDWDKSDKKIQGAVREDADVVAAWAPKYSRDKTFVSYCACPHDVTSARVGQILIGMGYNKTYVLKGGWKAWEKAGFPVEPK